MTIPLDLTGQTFGRWTVLGPAGKNKHRRTLWLVRCVCGSEASHTVTDLTKGKTLSCGCLRAEQLAARNKARSGRGRTPEQRREADRLRAKKYARPRPPCPCKWCGQVIDCPIKNQVHCSAECAWETILAAERATAQEKRARLTAAQLERRKQYKADWLATQAATRIAQDAARLASELQRRLGGGK